MRRILWTWGPALFFFLVVLVFSLSFYYRAPYHDHWDIVPYFAALQQGELQLGDLFVPHGGHWHATGYIAQLTLGELTGMAHWAVSFASVLFAGLGFVALLRMMTRSFAELNIPETAPWLISISAFFFFSLDQSANWLWGWQVAVFIMIAGAMWTIERLSAGEPSVANTLLAAGATAVSIYAFATGWALIPIGFGLLLAYGAMSSPTGKVCLGIWGGFTLLMLVHLYLARAGLPVSVSTLPDAGQADTWLGLSHYTINFVTSPVIRFARDSSLVAAAIGIGLFIWSLRTLKREEKRPILQTVAPFLALAALSWGAGFLSAIGRWEQFGVQQAFVSRYISFGSFFWISVFVLAIFAIAKTRHRTHMWTYSVLGLLLLLKVGNIPSVVTKSVELSQTIAATSSEIAAIYPDVEPADYAILHNGSQDVETYLETLSTHKVSFFHGGPGGPVAEESGSIAASETDIDR